MMKSLAILMFVVCTAYAGVAPSVPEMRLTTREVEQRAGRDSGSQVGSSKLPGVHTSILYGDPSKPGFYTVLLFVPAHTTIPAHSHRDSRMAAVLSGSWSFGYGNAFVEQNLKALPPGSTYSEPAGDNHFARTGDSPAVVEISGLGPTDTVYTDPANDPARKQ
jgi:quercetin dioxygenase-like cupin family protein